MSGSYHPVLGPFLHGCSDGFTHLYLTEFPDHRAQAFLHTHPQYLANSGYSVDALEILDELQ